MLSDVDKTKLINIQTQLEKIKKNKIPLISQYCEILKFSQV